MGRRGPAPTPTAVKLRQGETRPSRVKRMEPLPRRRAPAMPHGMDEAAQRVWRRVVREMRGSDVIVGADADVLRCYCEAVSRYAQAAQLYAASSPLNASGRRAGQEPPPPGGPGQRRRGAPVRPGARPLAVGACGIARRAGSDGGRHRPCPRAVAQAARGGRPRWVTRAPPVQASCFQVVPPLQSQSAPSLSRNRSPIWPDAGCDVDAGSNLSWAAFPLNTPPRPSS